MNIFDTIIAVSTIIFILNVIPQIIRNFQYKNTLTQSLTREVSHQAGMAMIIFIYFHMDLPYSVIMSFIDMFFRFVLIIQIIIWRNAKIL